MGMTTPLGNWVGWRTDGPPGPRSAPPPLGTPLSVQGKGDTPRARGARVDLPRLGVPRVLHPIAQIPAQLRTISPYRYSVPAPTTTCSGDTGRIPLELGAGSCGHRPAPALPPRYGGRSPSSCSPVGEHPAHQPGPDGRMKGTLRCPPSAMVRSSSQPAAGEGAQAGPEA